MACVAVLTLSACAADGSPASFPAPGMSTPSPAPAPIPIGVVGDSLSSGGPWDAVAVDPGSWTYYLDSRYEVTGGWRRDGATSTLMAANLQPFAADALVVLAGTNDVATGIEPELTLENVTRIADSADVRAVVLCAIPPYSAAPDRAAALNTALVGLARREGWTWVDPWVEARDGTAWREGATPDGIHGSLASYAQAAERIDDAVGRALEASPEADSAE
ncbi:SGNH/GDSL hydrolase family protein [Naasia aerilata]|uniref:SGNH/GDSL hydrolase family protein n=1 Tax=Naasia aerilata TaxID=1162966 RepID=UPI002572DB94|nr:GDSL-type esterase/lipase family protein [Naasia aerilata]